MDIVREMDSGKTRQFRAISKVLLLQLLYTNPLLSHQASADNHIGWNELPKTQLASVCPNNNFNGFRYNFKDYCKNVTLAWGGAAFDAEQSTMYIWGGGHHDYYGNELYTMNFANRSMTRLTDPAKPANPSAQPAPSELHPFNGTQPNSRHTYDGMAFIQHAKHIWAFSGSLASRSGNSDNTTWLFNAKTKQWTLDASKGDIPKGNYGVIAGYDPVTGNIFMHNRHAFYQYEFDSTGGRYTRLHDKKTLGLGLNAAIDPDRRYMMVIGRGNQILFSLDKNKRYQHYDVPLQGDSAIAKANAPGLAYNTKNKQFYGWMGDGKLYQFDYKTEAWRSVAYKGGPGQQVSAGTFGRFDYSHELDAFVLYNAYDQNAWLLKTTDFTDTEAPEVPTITDSSTPYPGAVKIQWEPAQDNLGVSGYRVYRNGEQVADQEETIFKDLMEKPAGVDTYQITALDSAGNESEKSKPFKVKNNLTPPQLRLGDCDKESALGGRNDIVFCESWDEADWWHNNGYLSDPIVNDPRPLAKKHVEHTSIVTKGCIQGNCLKVNMKEGHTRALSAFWPLIEANLAPQNLYLRYYLKLSDNWDINMCNDQGEKVGSGGKFPGLADVRTWADPGKQCGNGGARSNGKDCWSMRTLFKSCKAGKSCETKPEAAMRLGSYLYFSDQQGGTGDAALWDNSEWGQSKSGKLPCSSNPKNLSCGIGDGGVFERGIWYQIEMQVKMNTPGEANGTVRGWINSNLSYEKTNLKIREQGHDFLHNRLVWLNLYKGGVHGNCHTSSVYLDQLALALDKPIGGIDNPTASPPELTLSVDNKQPDKAGSVTIVWQGKEVNSCHSSGLWQGKQLTNGKATIRPKSSGFIRLECEGIGGRKVVRQVNIMVDGKSAGSKSKRTAGSKLTALSERPEKAVKLSTPSRLALESINQDRLKLSWERAPKNENVAGYQIFLQGTKIGETKDLEFTHVTLINGSTSIYSVRSFDTHGNQSEFSNNITVNIPAAPGSPPNEMTLLPTSDTMLNKSTNKVLGKLAYMDIAKNTSNALIKFPLNLVPKNRKIIKAQLVINSLKEYGNITLEVYKVTRNWDEYNASRDHPDVALEQKWINQLGDWEDRDSVALGQNSFASIVMRDDDRPNDTVIEITSLAQQWLEAPSKNFGLLLTTVTGINHRIATKEYENSALWPKLVLTLNRE